MPVCANERLAPSLSFSIYRSQLSLILEDHTSQCIESQTDIEEEIHSWISDEAFFSVSSLHAIRLSDD